MRFQGRSVRNPDDYYHRPLGARPMADMTSLWPGQTLGHTECGFADVARLKFLSQVQGEAVTIQREYILDTNQLAIADVMADAINPRGRIISPAQYFVAVEFENVFAVISSREAPVTYEYTGQDDDWGTHSKLSAFTIEATGPRELCNIIHTAVQKAFAEQQHSQIVWWYQDDTRTNNKTVYLPPIKTTLRPEFYPDLHDPRKFLDEFLKSDASVLLMAGEPGTGKTTLLRHLICDHKLKAHVVYDENLMKSDKVFQSFLFGDGDVMVIEDADTILGSREDANNKLMARFLNVSDGLIKLPDKKLVFTTNISDFGRVDPALLRPGRCFAVLHTRALNLDEAQAAARAAGLPVPLQRGEYTLAQLFNQSKKQASVRSIGFNAQGA